VLRFCDRHDPPWVGAASTMGVSPAHGGFGVHAMKHAAERVTELREVVTEIREVVTELHVGVMKVPRSAARVSLITQR
jgi:hypothetical protein